MHYKALAICAKKQRETAKRFLGKIVCEKNCYKYEILHLRKKVL